MAITSECDPNQATRRVFSLEGLKVVVPDAVADSQIRWLVERGRSIKTAFAEAGQSHNTPDPAIVPCAEEVFSVKYYDLVSGTWKATSRGYTCNGMWTCFTEYVGGGRYFPGRLKADKRLWITEGLFVPSPNEEACIKQHFRQSKDLEAAYRACGCANIIPEWPTCLPFVAQALTADPAGYMYTAIKTWYRLQYATGWPPNGIPQNGNGIPIHHHAHLAREVVLPWVVIAAVGVLALIKSD